MPRGIVYLDGNSLGVLPKATPARLARVIEHEWGHDLIRSWNSAGWIDMAQRVGDKIAPLIGASAGEVIAADSTSINLYKVLETAVRLQAGSTNRRLIVSERSNFPTDLYIADSVARAHGMTLKLVDVDTLEAHLDGEVAVLMLTHVNYRTGRLLDMAAITRAAQAVGALMVWDLAHSAGAMPLDLTGANADFAVGCGYKYLNGGPGAPAFVWVHPRHTDRMDATGLAQPLSGWLGHAAPFAFTPDYQPAAGIQRFVCGTPPVLSMAALEVGLDVFAKAAAFGGLEALRRKSIALTALFIDLVEGACDRHGLSLVTPRDPACRGSQISLACEHGQAVMQAMIHHGVIGDFRSGDPTRVASADSAGSAHLLRFGFTPLYTRFVDAWDAADRLAQVLDSGEWREPRFARHAAVT